MAITPMDFYKYLGLGSGSAQALGGAASLFGGGGRNPADAANKYLQKIPGAISPYYQPYIEAGKQALPELQNQYGQLTGNTGDVYNRLSEGYKQSPGYRYALEQALSGVNNAAAAGGTLGTLGHQQLGADVTEGLASRDFENYLNHMLGLYGSGLEGLGNLNNMGYGASTGYASELGSNLAQQAANAFAGEQFKNTQRSSGLSNLFSGIGNTLPFMFL